jgi:Fusaric acid resistance protein family
MAEAPYFNLRRDAAGARPEALLAVLRQELALRPHRLRSALRSATLTALAAGLMAAAHVNSSLGPYVVWLLAGTPTAMLRWRTAVVFTIVEGAALAIAVVLARVLSQSPVLMLVMIVVLGALSTYLIGRFKFGVFGIVNQVLVFDTLYLVMFAPDQIGWSAAATFSGLGLGVGLIALFDNWIWPDPAEAILVESLVDNLRRVRTSLVEAAQSYLAETGAGGPPRLMSVHDLSPNLTLVARARAEGISEHRRGVLVAAITRVSRLQSLANLLVMANDRLVARVVRRAVAPEIQAAINTIGAALDELCTDPAAMLRSGYGQTPSPAVSRLQSSLAALDARVIEVRPAYLATTGAPELSNFSSFLTCLRSVCRLIDRPLDESAVSGPPAPATEAPLDPATVRYCLKVAVALVVGYVIGLMSQRPDLSTIMTTVIITALPTYGAAARKMILRVTGAIVGGAIVVLMVIVVSPNFETLPAYVIAIFLALVVSGYTGQSSERFAYAGKQIGTVVMLTFAGLSPSVAVEAPLWRLWGILIGTLVVLIVSLTLWPEYAANFLPSRLRQLLKLTLALAPGTVVDVSAIRRLETDLNGVLEQTLAVADDARLEGHTSKLDPDAVVRTAGTVRRIAHRLEEIALSRMMHARPDLDPLTENAARVALVSVVAQLQLWLAWIESPAGIGTAPPSAQANQATMTQALSELNARLEADSFARLNGWQFDQRRTLFTEIESLRRLSILITELDEYLTQVPSHWV